MLHTMSVVLLVSLGLAQSADPNGAASNWPYDAASDRKLDEILEFVRPPDQIWLTTKAETSVNDAPGIVDVLDHRDIERWGFRSLVQGLARSPGYYVVDDHVVPNVALRGVSGGESAPTNLVKVLVNGWSSDEFSSTGANWVGPEWVPFTAIKRIEMVRGPASVLFGSDAFLGAFNLVTKTGDDFVAAGTLGDIVLGGGLTGTNPKAYDVDIATGTRVGALEMMLAGRFNGDDRSGMLLPSSSPAPQIPPYKSDLLASGLTSMSVSAVGNLRYHMSANTYLEATPRFAWIDRGEEFGALTQLTHGVDAHQVARGTRVDQAKGLLGLHLASVLSDELSVDAAVTLRGGGVLPPDRIDTGGNLYARRTFSYFAVDINGELRWTPVSTLTLRAGVEYNLDTEQLPEVRVYLADGTASAQAGSIIDELTATQPVKDFRNLGAVLEATWAPDSAYLTLVAGLRYDYHLLYGSQPNGRIALVSPFTDWLTAKLLVGTAFKAPSPFLLYANPVRVGDVVGNPGLKPMHVMTAEGELRAQPNHHWDVAVAVAANHFTDLASFATRGINQIARNVGSTDVLSVEASLRGEEKGFFGYATGTYTLGNRTTGQTGYVGRLLSRDVEAFPRWLTSAGLGWEQAAWHVRGLLNVQVVGTRTSTDSNSVAAAQVYNLPTLVKLGASAWLYDFETAWGPVTARVSAENLLGSSGPDPGYGGVDYPLVPRSFFVYLSHSQSI